jgi:hypothetical protein
LNVPSFSKYVSGLNRCKQQVWIDRLFSIILETSIHSIDNTPSNAKNNSAHSNIS